MRALDSLLGILVQQGGDELRLVAKQRPRMFAGASELSLTMPVMSADGIRHLLDDLWRASAGELARGGQVTRAYRSAELGTFAVHLTQRDGGPLEVAFRRAIDEGAAAMDNEAEAVIGAVPPALYAVLSRAQARGASDVHLGPGAPPVMRVNGALALLDDVPPCDPAVLLGERGEGEVSVDRALEVPGIGRLRVNVYRSAEGLCAAIRLLRREAPDLAALNLPPQLAALTELPHGLVIACGPTGCGKSTTLAALLEHALRARARVLVTLEDPIEYRIRPQRPAGLVRQREVGTHVRDFASGLRDALREDPDLLLIGEMRDPETISLALTAAETGHLVFASLHSRTAPSAIERVVDTYPPERQRQVRVQLAEALRAVVAQRLVATADGGGVVPAVEILRVTHGVANLIREHRTAQLVSALQAGGAEGMLVLERHLADLVRGGRIARDAALTAANDPATLQEYLRQ
ncbi:PilT/PilU family type 4a pilus ATPase [bacterium]|nr:PilT/PilU family type 4a pilus ATPase [bacterium]